MAADLNINASVSGIPELDALDKKLQALQSAQMTFVQAKQVGLKQYELERMQLIKQVQLLNARKIHWQTEGTQIAALNNLKEDMTQQEQHRMAVEQEALRYRQVYYREGIQLSMEEARVVAENNMAIIESEKLKEIAIAKNMRTMRYTAQAFFMTTMAMNKMLQSLKPLVKGNEELEETLEAMQVSFNVIQGPMQAFMGIMMLAEVTSIGFGNALMYVGAGMGVLFLMTMAITAKTREMRAVFSALAGVLTLIALLQMKVAISSFLAASGMAALQAVMGNPAALLAIAAGVGVAAFAIGEIKSMQKGQVLTGHSKKVRKGGLAILDDDERITREHKGGTRGGGGDIVINLPESYNGSMADAKITANQVRRYVNAGYGNIKYKRKVVTG